MTGNIRPGDFMQSIRLVHEFFKGDWDKTILWFHTDNPLLGQLKPIDLHDMNRDFKLLKFIQNQLAENKPE